MAKERKKDDDQLELDLEDENQTEEVIIEEEEKEEAPSQPGESSEQTGVTVEDGIGELKAQLERERQARHEAELRAKEATQQAQRARVEVEDTNLHLVNSAINEVRRENLWYKSAIREALQTGDYDKAAEYQEAIAVNVSKLNRLEEGKVAMESRPKRDEPVASDPVETFASQLSPRSADWVRRNPQCVTDPRLNQKMIAAHNLAVADGYVPDSDDYFSFIEGTLKMGGRREVAVEESYDSPMSSAAKPVQRRSAPPAAPVSRSAMNGSGSRPGEIRLTKDQVEAAKISGITPREYYAQLKRQNNQ